MSLQITTLNKIYPNGVKALDNLSLTIGTGMFGLLGPNGAGKSTLMRTLATLQSPDDGSIFFNDIDVLSEQIRLRRVLGYLPQSFGVYPKVSAVELLDYFAILKGVASAKDRARLVDEVLQITNLYEVRKKYVDGYSGGMKQRFGIAQLLLNSPKLIIVDEPTAGLDPAERQRFLNILREIGTHNTVIFSTHIVDDIRELCHDLAIMNGGRVLSKTTPQQAAAEIDGRIWLKTINRSELETMEQKYDVLSSSYNQDNSINVRVYASCAPEPGFLYCRPELEDAYFWALMEDQTTAHNG